MGIRFSCNLNLMMNRPYLAVRASDLEPGETALPAVQSWPILERELRNPRDLAGLMHLWRAMGGNSFGPSGTIRTEVLKEAFVTGRWVLVPRTKQATMLRNGAPAETVGEQLKLAKVVKTWIEMEVVDEDGKPMPGQAYQCMMPDGRIEHGNLDSKGRVRFDGIDPGNCAFTLTDVAPDLWARIS